MGSITTAQCSDVTLHKLIARPSPPIDPVAPERRSGAGVEVAGNSRCPKPNATAGYSGARPAAFHEAGIGAREVADATCTVLTRDEVLAHSASARSASRDALEALWASVATCLDAYFARLVGRGHSLEEPAVQDANCALRARDCAALMDHLQRIWDLEGGDKPAVHAEASRISDAEERHVVLCQLEDAIRRADVDDMELWLDEALNLGLSVDPAQRYCEDMRAALRELWEDTRDGLHSRDAGADTGTGDNSAWETAATTCSSGGPEDALAGAGVDFETWNTAFSDPFTFIDASEFSGGTADAPTPAPCDDSGAAERDAMWVQLEEALRSKDVDSALEAIAMLESIGELDADTAAEARTVAEEQRAQFPHFPSSAVPSDAVPKRRASAPNLRFPSWDSPTGDGTSAGSTSAPYRRDADAASAERASGGYRGDRSPNKRGSRERSGAGWAAHVDAVRAANAATTRETTNWSAWKSSSDTAKGNHERGQSEAAAQQPKPGSRAASSPTRVPSAPAVTKKPSVNSSTAPESSTTQSPNLGIRGRLFKEALWKRRANLQTFTRMGGSAPSSSQATREQARRSYASTVRNAVHENSGAADRSRQKPWEMRVEQGFEPSDGDEFDRMFPARSWEPRTAPTSEPRVAPADQSAPKGNIGPTGRQRPTGLFNQSVPKMRATSVGAEAPERHPPSSTPVPPAQGRGSFSSAEAPHSTPASPPPQSRGSFFNYFRESRSSSAPKESTPKKTQPRTTPEKPQPAAPPPPQRSPPKVPPQQPPPKASAAPKNAPPRASSRPKSNQNGAATSGSHTSPGASAKPPPAAEPRSSTPAPQESPMELLELKPGFTDSDLRAAYKRAAMRWHPDRPAWRAAGEEEVQHATEMFQKCKDAYDILSGKPAR